VATGTPKPNASPLDSAPTWGKLRADFARFSTKELKTRVVERKTKKATGATDQSPEVTAPRPLLKYIAFENSEGLRVIAYESYELDLEIREPYLFYPYIESLLPLLLGEGVATDERKPRKYHGDWSVMQLLTACASLISSQGLTLSRFCYSESLSDWGLVPKLITLCRGAEKPSPGYDHELESRLPEAEWHKLGGEGVAPYISQIVAGLALLVLDATMECYVSLNANERETWAQDEYLPRLRNRITKGLCRVVDFTVESAKLTVRESAPTRRKIWGGIKASSASQEQRLREWNVIAPHISTVAKYKGGDEALRQIKKIVPNSPDFPAKRAGSDWIRAFRKGNPTPWEDVRQKNNK
jgi:hypothetical protein